MAPWKPFPRQLLPHRKSNHQCDGINGIQVAANNVTVDLNGFALINTTGTGGAAISVGTGDYMVHIKNGTIRGGTTVSNNVFTKKGWRDGIAMGSRNLWVTDVMVIGAREDGISGYHGIVERCVVDACGETGIWTRKVSDSVARSCGGWGISSAGNNDNGIITNCYGESIATSGQSAGIAASGGIVTNSVGISTVWVGIQADIASHCKGISTSLNGISIAETADNCLGESTSGIGISATVATNCVARSTSGTSALQCKTASFCRATRTGGTAIFADIAIGCTTDGGTISAAQKHLGTP